MKRYDVLYNRDCSDWHEEEIVTGKYVLYDDHINDKKADGGKLFHLQVAYKKLELKVDRFRDLLQEGIDHAYFGISASSWKKKVEQALKEGGE